LLRSATRRPRECFRRFFGALCSAASSIGILLFRCLCVPHRGNLSVAAASSAVTTEAPHWPSVQRGSSSWAKGPIRAATLTLRSKPKSSPYCQKVTSAASARDLQANICVLCIYGFESYLPSHAFRGHQTFGAPPRIPHFSGRFCGLRRLKDWTSCRMLELAGGFGPQSEVAIFKCPVF
jgi:hypothetical protein